MCRLLPTSPPPLQTFPLLALTCHGVLKTSLLPRDSLVTGEYKEMENYVCVQNRPSLCFFRED